jgi:hypothetical protein
MQPHVMKKQHHLQQQESSTKKNIIVYTYKEQCQGGTDIKNNVLVQPENGHGYTMSVLKSYVTITNQQN